MRRGWRERKTAASIATPPSPGPASEPRLRSGLDETVLVGLLRDARRGDELRHVLAGLPRQAVGDPIVVRVRAALATGHLTHDPTDTTLAGVVSGRGQIPRAEPLMQIAQV